MIVLDNRTSRRTITVHTNTLALAEFRALFAERGVEGGLLWTFMTNAWWLYGQICPLTCQWVPWCVSEVVAQSEFHLRVWLPSLLHLHHELHTNRPTANTATSYQFSISLDNGASKMLRRKVGGLMFTYEQLAQLARHSHPDNEKNAGRMGVFIAISGTAHELGSQFIYVDYPVQDKPGETIPGFVYLLYARLSDEPKTKFKSFRAGPHVAEFRKVFAERGVEGDLPFYTILGV
ncbi:hypothetical protein BU15DRAFT_65067 [Melanogaster broomeanus]|nr:hypothetical protein BU15DRAFT_65067 [Melanogaster broomeanus]